MKLRNAKLKALGRENPPVLRKFQGRVQGLCSGSVPTG